MSDKLLNSKRNSKINSKIKELNILIKYFDTSERELEGIIAEQYMQKLTDQNNERECPEIEELNIICKRRFILIEERRRYKNLIKG